jgi:hypothetical protein
MLDRVPVCQTCLLKGEHKAHEFRPLADARGIAQKGLDHYVRKIVERRDKYDQRRP